MMIKDSGSRREFETGAVRDIQTGKGRCDLMPLSIIGMCLDSELCSEDIFNAISDYQTTGDYSLLKKALTEFSGFANMETMFLEVAKHFEAGAEKYGEHNWQKGIPTKCYIDSAVRHYLKYLRGDDDEPHDRAFCWNIICCMWTCANIPELNSYAGE